MHVVITGASSGIGRALAYAFASQGASLTLVARRKDKLEEIQRDVSVPVCIHAIDLSESDVSTDWISRSQNKLGAIDVFINNAGSQSIGAFHEVPREEATRHLNLCLVTPLKLIQTVLPEMLRRKSGTLVTISSVAAFTHNAGMVHYVASKAGMGAASESLRAELKGSGVNVLTVYPGPVLTEMSLASFEKHDIQPKHVPSGNVKELANLIQKAIRTKKANLIYPRIYQITSFSPIFSRWVTNLYRPIFLRKAIQNDSHSLTS